LPVAAQRLFQLFQSNHLEEISERYLKITISERT
jgi:hypothetical protein